MQSKAEEAYQIIKHMSYILCYASDISATGKLKGQSLSLLLIPQIASASWTPAQ